METNPCPTGGGSSGSLDRLKAEWSALKVERPHDDVPEGWITVEGYAGMMGLSVSHSQRILRTLLQQGSVERREFHIPRGAKMIKIAHYKIVRKEGHHG